MTIHIYQRNTFPHGMAAAKRRLCYIKGLTSAGDTVDVTVCAKVVERDNDDGFPAEGDFQGTHYKYVCGKFKHAKWNKLMRGLDWEVLDSIRSFFYALNHVKKGDIVFMYFYGNLLEILLLWVCKIKGAKSVREVCEHPSSLGANTIMKRFARWFEYHVLFPQFDGFVAISRSLEEFVNQYKSKKATTIIVPILVDEDSTSFNPEQYPKQYDVPYIIHTGTMLEQKDSISKILKAFAQFKKDDTTGCRLVFTGPQANSKCQYIPMMEELGIRDYVDLLGLVPVEQVASLQHFATMTIIYKSDNLQTRNCFPTKLGEMLISGVPVITTSVGDANLYLKHGESAMIIDPDDESALCYNIRFLLKDEKLRQAIGGEGMNVAIKSFNPFLQGEKLSVFLKKIMHKKTVGYDY